ncbi:MAG: Na+/H+ antiporter NhaA [Rickettsiaceae bacterium]|jgi:NhaA family Na+:H+ antiporter|nr:Na+/H+ antiporter NhaA [Rickettsiaceae bacterium]
MLARIRNFIKVEENTSIPLFLSLIAAIFISNSLFSEEYFSIIRYVIEINLFGVAYSEPFIKIFNESMMALFFLMIVLEMKYQLNNGEFNNKKNLLLPVFTAIGGASIPTLIYFLLNRHDLILVKGWAIPMATDTAFMLGMLSLFSRRIPSSARVFVIGFALIDDALSISVMALFYTSHINLYPLIFSIICISLLFALNKMKVRKPLYYILLFVPLWVSIFQSGITATIAGVITALFIPSDYDEYNNSPARKIEKILHPIVNYLILPTFVLLNSGISFEHVSLEEKYISMSLGIILGLLCGKPIGFLSSAFLAVKFLKVSLPEGLNIPKFIGIGLLTGFGYVINLFIGDLAFNDYVLENQMRFSVIVGSLFAATISFVVLSIVTRPQS